MAGPDGEAELQQTPVPDGEDGVGQVGVDHHLALAERLEHGIFIETKTCLVRTSNISAMSAAIPV